MTERAVKRERLRDELLNEACLTPGTPAAEAYLNQWRETWISENAGAIASFNAWIERNGLPLERYRQF